MSMANGARAGQAPRSESAVLEAALRYLRDGASILPVALGGSKAPACDDRAPAQEGR